MKTLYIMRHAKSDWGDTALPDFERPLNDRGLKTAPSMGELMREKEFTPQLIVSSRAKRAEQTARLVKQSAQFEAEIRFEEKIYEASVSTLLQIVAEINDEFESVMLVGHNPGFEHLVRVLTGKPEPMPTAALAVIDLEIESWSDVSNDCGKLRKLIRPKDEIK